MRVLILGSGAREHALCWSASRSPQLETLYCAPGNGGTAQLAENIALAPMDFEACAAWAERNAIDLTIVGPDDPLGGGIVDVFQARGLRVFGPHQAAARIESSKAFAKQLMLEAGVPTAPAHVFNDRVQAEMYLDRYAAEDGRYPLVIKADGLATGKGVFIARDIAEARDALDALMVARTVGAAGETVLIEDYLQGMELSLFALTDGERVVSLVPACDYKRAYDDDEGPNTGGMGAYSPPRFATPALLAHVEARILKPTVAALARQGPPFRGLLYAGLILTENGPYVLEFNARFGDPETQVVLPRLEGDLLQLCSAVADGKLDRVPAPRWTAEAACGVVLASEGYPGPYEKGHEITGLDALDGDILVFHAGTRWGPDGRLVTSGGRVLTLVARGASVAEARARVYANVERVRFQGARWRSDIGAREHLTP
ncbi:MAG TPA: phosphoribosylamine--glycine ligase [Ktedonobacterales bacterium]|jgi:phosphoribosylamine--glycine ligase|nr:phosphoribosylamine--glycine ligase [Ktedonobacterales bacterium]